MFYNGIIKIVLASILYFMIGGLLTFRFGINNSILSIINTILSVISCILIVWFSFKLLKITKNLENNSRNEKYLQKYGELTKEMKPEVPMVYKAYTFVFLLRRGLLVLVLTLLGEYTEGQLGAVGLIHA